MTITQSPEIVLLLHNHCNHLRLYYYHTITAVTWDSITITQSLQSPGILGSEVEECPGFALDLESSPSFRRNTQSLVFALQCAQRTRLGGGEGCGGIVKSVGRDG